MEHQRWSHTGWEVTMSRTTTILDPWQILILATQRCCHSSNSFFCLTTSMFLCLTTSTLLRWLQIGDRAATLLFFLSTPDAGGATVFPLLGISVTALTKFWQGWSIERVMCNIFWIFMLFQAVNIVKLNFKAGLFSSTFQFERSFLAKSQC